MAVADADLWYSYPNVTDSRGIAEFFGYIHHTVTEGLFFPVILLLTWIISFSTILAASGFDKSSAPKAFAFSSFFCSILALILTLSGFLEQKYMYLLFVLTAAGFLWIKAAAPTTD